MNNMIIKTWLVFCFGIISTITCIAQQKAQTTKDDPVELATIVIQGTEAVDIPGGTKQPPRKTIALTRDRLDSLNTLEKHTAIRLPFVALPTTSLERPITKGYVQGELGQFLTPLLDAGYGFAIGGYRLEANGGLEASNGHVNNADFTNFRFSLDAEYVAPEKFIFFGGSKTQTFVRFSRDAHNLYAIPTAVHRSLTDFSVGVRTDGSYDGYTYSLGGDWNAGSLAQSNNDAVNNALHGFIGATKRFDDLVLGAEANLQFHTLRGNGLNMMDLLANANYVQENYKVRAKAGLQSYTNANGATFGAIKVIADGEYFLSGDITIGGFIRSGLLENSFIRMMRVNPYIINSAEIEYARENIAVGGRLWYHPLEKVSVMMKGTFASIGNYSVWQGNQEASFALRYTDVTLIEAEAEAVYTYDEHNVFNANVQTRSVKSAKENVLPYILPFQTSIRWNRNWNKEIGTELTTSYMGTRSTGSGVVPQLSGYFDISLRASYSINSTLQAYIRVDNITNSTIFVWDGYKERGIFFAAGVLYNF